MKVIIVGLTLLLVLASAMPGGVNTVDPTEITPEIREIEKFLRKTYPGLVGAELIEVTQQVVAGVIYCLHFRLANAVPKKICVWSRPWLNSLEVVTQGLEDLKSGLIVDLSENDGN